MEFGFNETTERNAHMEEFREFGKEHTLPGCALRPALVAGEAFGLIYPCTAIPTVFGLMYMSMSRRASVHLSR